MHIAILTVSDRASRGEYEDLSGPAIEDWIRKAVTSDYHLSRTIVADGRQSVGEALKRLCDEVQADLILTTGGTGPSPRDETPEAMADILEKELPGFGELMRMESLKQVPTAILSRQTAGIRGRSLIINLPGKPSSIAVTLNAVFPAVPYCLDLIGAGRIETDPLIVQAFRPKA